MSSRETGAATIAAATEVQTVHASATRSSGLRARPLRRAIYGSRCILSSELGATIMKWAASCAEPGTSSDKTLLIQTFRF